MAKAPIEWFSFLLIRDLPSEFNSIVWRSGIADIKKQFGEKQSAKTACQGYVYAAAVDFGTTDDHDTIACPTAYCRVRTDQRWNLAIVPYCVPMNTTKYLGVDCRVLRVIKAKDGLDRAVVAAEYNRMAELHNNRTLEHAYPFNIRRIGTDYSLACSAFFGYACSKSERPAASDELWMDLQEARETEPFPLEIDEAAAEWQEEYDYAIRVAEVPPIGWPLPDGLVSSFYSERPYCFHEEDVGAGIDAVYETLKHNDPGWKRNEEAIYETMIMSDKTKYLNALFIHRRPYLSDRAGFKRLFASGHVIYRPYPAKSDSVLLLSVGVNRDERRQGYAGQMMRMLARQYPSLPIKASVGKDDVEFLALMLGMRAQISESKGGYDCEFSLTNLFPMERDSSTYLKTKGTKRPKK